MTPVWQRLLSMVEEHEQAAMVSVIATAGSAPREAGARMLVRTDGAFFGTVGGGALEWALLTQARKHLAQGLPAAISEHSLGPELAQCCGGRVSALIEVFDHSHIPALRALRDAERQAGGITTQTEVGGQRQALLRRPITKSEPGYKNGVLTEHFGDTRTQLLLFGAGHVGRALVLALAPLPFRVRWVDSRTEAFPPFIPDNTEIVSSNDPAQEIAAATPGSFVLVMTHSHPLDLAITTAALRRDELPFVGLIGSATKRVRFERRMRDAGLPESAIQRLVCPIGVSGIEGKEPAVIAASVVAQMLVALSAQECDISR